MASQATGKVRKDQLGELLAGAAHRPAGGAVMTAAPLDVRAIRRHFTFPGTGPGCDEQRGEHAAAT